jgi:citrate lyase subunit beta/citryl-CoA lyase
MTVIRPRRSVLYMPGSNARAIEKAKTLAADALILDLEDAVAPESKELARKQVCDAVKAGGFGKRELIIRVNGLWTQWGEEDLSAAIAAMPDAILVPKVSSAADLQAIEERFSGHDTGRKIAIWAMMETPLAILNAAQIASAGGRLRCFVMGTNDLIKEFRGQHTPDRANLSAALGISILDSCKQARSYGFDGKTLIHPSQIEPCNDVFAPSQAEVEAAQRIIAAFNLPENKGKGAISLDGRMVELLHAEIARQTVAMADAIAAQQDL